MVVFALLAGSWACDGLNFDPGDGERHDRADTYTGPFKRTAMGENVRCFDTFGQFKTAMRKQGKGTLGKNYHWHHIVPQHPDNKKKFGERNLHCTDNLVYLGAKEHQKISTYYSRKREDRGDKSLRDLLKPLSFAEQYVAGCHAMKELNVEYTEAVCP